MASDNFIHFKQRKGGGPPCVAEQDKLLSVLEIADHKIGPVYKYVKAVDDCMQREKEARKVKPPSNKRLLRDYLDLKKFKVK
mmetsp:Transcript_148/g.224  ORF Transcript_148/g.224 Transcript_148/m.224 type:complete len:82 (-) Transcript_148:30-275(-)